MSNQKSFDWEFSNDSKYIIKWYERPAAPQILDVKISVYKTDFDNYANKDKEVISVAIRKIGMTCGLMGKKRLND